MTIQDFNTVIVQRAFSPDVSINLKWLTKAYSLTRQVNMASYHDMGDDWPVEFRSKLQPAKGLLYLHIQREDVNYIIENSILLHASVTSVVPDMTLSMLCIYEAVCCSRECLCFWFIVRTQIQRSLKNPSTGGGDTGLTQDNQFDVLGTEGVLCGDEFCSYEDFSLETVAQEKKFDWLGLLRNAALGVAVGVSAIAVGAFVVGTGGLGAIVGGALIGAGCGALAVTAAMTVEDCIDGDVRSLETAGAQILGGMVIGAVTGAFVAAAVPAGVTLPLWQTGVLSVVNGASMRLSSTLAMEHASNWDKFKYVYLNPLAIGWDLAFGVGSQMYMNNSIYGTPVPNKQQMDMHNAPIYDSLYNPPQKTGNKPNTNSSPNQGGSALMNNLDEALEQQGLSLDEFNSLRLRDVSTLSEAEKASLKAIRESIPMPDPKTVMQKVIPAQDIKKYLDGTYTQVGGYVTRAEDVSQLGTYDDIYNSLRLDYPNSAYKPATDSSLGIIKYTTDEATKISIPYSSEMGGSIVNPDPFTGNGFTKATNGQIIPEFVSNEYLYIADGSQLIEVTKDGTQILKAIYSAADGGFIPVQ